MESFQTTETPDGCWLFSLVEVEDKKLLISKSPFSLNLLLPVEEIQACDTSLLPVESWLSTPCISQSQHWTLASSAFTKVASLLCNIKIQWILISNFLLS